MDRHRPLARPRVRRRLPFNNNMANAALAIQAAARGFLARRRVARMRPRLMSPMDIQRRFRSAKRPQGQVVVPKVFPKARIGSVIGTEKSKRSVSMKKVDPLEIKFHIDLNSEVQQSQVAYFGFADAGWQDDQLTQGCMALTQLFFRRSGMKLPTINMQLKDALSTPPDQPPLYFRPKLRRIELLFVNIDQEGAQSSTLKTIDVDDQSSIYSVARDIRDAVVEIGTAAIFPVKKWPIMAKLYSHDNHSSKDIFNVFATYDLENTMVDFAYKRKYKWVNVTPAADGGGNNINDINANPLSGRIYKFKGPTPLLRASVKDYNVELMMDGIEDQGVDNSSAIACNRFRQLNNYSNPPKTAFRQPFKAVQFFKNTETEDKVYMPPGGYKQLIRGGKVTMNFKRFCQATVKQPGITGISDGIEKPPKIGTSTIWALEPALRTDVNELVKVHVNSETWYTTKCRVGEKKQPVATGQQVLEGPTFGPV